jgi:hypothetical protein
VARQFDISVRVEIPVGQLRKAVIYHLQLARYFSLLHFCITLKISGWQENGFNDSDSSPVRCILMFDG